MTTSLFIFGTLLDKDVLEWVCQQPIDNLERKPASLIGFEPRYVVDQHFPVLVLAPKSTTYGDVVAIDDVLLERLSEYERDDFQLCEVSVKLEDGTDCRCQYFANVGYEKISDQRWTLEDFQLCHKEKYLQYLRQCKGLPTLH